jgi:hypothetical protein
MRYRTLQAVIRELCFEDHKMAFVSGPRQVGKTTLAKRLLEPRTAAAYHNWDDIAFRRIWAKAPGSTIPRAASGAEGVPLVVFDEIHKARGWKRSLKGIYDTREAPVDILVTGSARLTVYRRGGDSLMGRYHDFRLHPFTLGELDATPVREPDAVREAIFAAPGAERSESQKTLEALLRFGGFPEPLLAASERKARLWRRERVERVIREDLRDLSRIPELSRLELLASLIPERVGSPLSRAALRELLEVSFDTIRRWVTSLDDLYYLFEIKPWQRSVSRTLRKEGKVYLWDWSEVPDPAARFENLVASHLLKLCHYLTDAGYGTLALWCLRTKDGYEIDFLVTRDGRPWLPVEVKLADPTLSPSWSVFLRQLPVERGLQLVAKPGVWRSHSVAGAKVVVADAARVLGCLP